MVLPPYRKPGGTELKATLKAATPKDLGNNESEVCMHVCSFFAGLSQPLLCFVFTLVDPLNSGY